MTDFYEGLNEALDLPELEQLGGFVYPKGTYHLLVTSIEERTADDGRRKWEVHFKIIGGEHDGKNMVDFIWLTPPHIKEDGTKSKGSLWRVVDLALAAMLPYPRGTELSAIREALHGRELNAKVTVRPADEEAGYSESNQISYVRDKASEKEFNAMRKGAK